jgi:APA family basic amino acid/polyamine antiporter
VASIVQHALRRKPVSVIAAETGSDGGDGQLKRSIGLFGLVAIGVGSTIGTGIFFILREAVPPAGPAVIVSFLLAAVVAGLTAMCYAELAGAVPVAGSSYSYAYTTLGEAAAVVVGACLLLEWGVAGAATAVGWSEYINQFLGNVFGHQLPVALSGAPSEGGVCNVPAILLVFMCAALLIRGVSESAKVNTIMVAIKLLVLTAFVIIGAQGFQSGNLHPFMPDGVGGVTVAAGLIFFSFVGLDGVAAAGEEAKNPHRNLPLALMISLLVVTGMYVAVALVAVGAQPASQFEGQKAGLAKILEDVVHAPWPGTALAVGAIISIFSVTLVTIYGQTRILFAMSRDGMISPVFHKVNPRTLAPVHNTVIVGVVIAVLAGFIPLDKLSEMTSIGTLTAFIVVSIGVILLRRRAPELPRTFKVPLYPITPILSIAGAGVIIYKLQTTTLLVFAAWMALALLWYVVYARGHSKLNRHAPDMEDLLEQGGPS